MKMLTSIGLVAVIALSLFAARAVAQIDSTYQVILSSRVSAPYTEYVHEFQFGQASDYTSPQIWHFQCTDTITSIVFDSVRIHNQNDPGTTFLWFEVDDRTQFLRGFKLRSSNHAAGITMSVDSLPFVRRSSMLIEVIQGVYSCHYHVSGYSYFTIPRPGQGFAEFTDRGDSIAPDTISLSITRIASNALVLAKPLDPQRLTLSPKNQFIEATFESADDERSMVLTDLLGIKMASFNILPGSSHELFPASQLPPGCYFARLGDQIAKFVVPPR